MAQHKPYHSLKWFLYDQDFGWDYPYVESQYTYNIFEFVTEGMAQIGQMGQSTHFYYVSF